MLVDGHDLRDVTRVVAALADGHRAAGGRSCSAARVAREHRLRPAGRDAPRRSPTPRAPSAPTPSSRRCPHGYDTEVGERGVQLSAGQRQLLAFARALIADPRILILDEATSNVDLHTEGRIETGLRRLLAGRTAIVIAHRLSTIRQAGRIVVLDHGRDRRAGHPRRADGRPGRLLAPLPRLGRAGRGVGQDGVLHWPPVPGWCNWQHACLWSTNLGFESLSRSSLSAARAGDLDRLLERRPVLEQERVDADRARDREAVLVPARRVGSLAQSPWP